LEGEWSLGRAKSLLVFVLMLGPLMVAPMATIAGMIAGITLFRFGRHVFAKTAGRTSEASRM
jgi:hypothetical protein